jgi:hypothetical protein
MQPELSTKRSTRKSRIPVDVHQNKFDKGYISTIDNSRRPTDSLADMTNIEVVQDSVLQPRPSLVRYGMQPSYPVIGRGNAHYGGLRSQFFMMNVSGTGEIFQQTDGGSFTSVGGSYDDSAWAGFVQAQGKVFPFNAVDNLSYVLLSDNSIHTYTGLATPSAPSLTPTGMSGSTFPHYYAVSAINDVGESIGSVATSIATGKVRDSWLDGTDSMAISWTAVPGAVGYTVYYGTTADTQNELYTVSGNATTSFTDDGTLSVNPYKITPVGDSSAGAIFLWMYVDAKNSQIYGISTDGKLYYSAAGTADFSPFNGGGWVAIDDQGATQLNYVDGFHDGHGDPVITVSARGAAGKGKLFHVTFDQETVGDQIIIFPNVVEAPSEFGTYSARGTIKARDALYYFTGEDVRTTGISQNILNILTTQIISQVIIPDMANINAENLYKSVGIELRDRLFWALPVGSTENSEIWYLDLSRNSLWVLRWPIAAKDMWLYEDNDGVTHHCVLVDNVILEFTRAGSQTHQDDNVPWRSRIGFQSLVWDEDGLTLASIRRQYFKFLFPKGNINVNATGLSRTGVQSSAGSAAFSSVTTPTGIGIWDYSGDYKYGDDPGSISTYGKSVAVLQIKPRGLVNQLDWEVVADTANTDYILSAVNTVGFSLANLTLKT